MNTAHTRISVLVAAAALAAAFAAPARADTDQYDNFFPETYGSSQAYGSAQTPAATGQAYGGTVISPSGYNGRFQGSRYNFSNLPRDTRNEGFNSRYGLDWGRGHR